MFEFLLTIRQKKERLPTYAPLLPVVSIPVRGDRREAIWPSLTDPRFGSGGPLERERRLLPRGDSPSILVVVVVVGTPSQIRLAVAAATSWIPIPNLSRHIDWALKGVTQMPDAISGLRTSAVFLLIRAIGNRWATDVRIWISSRRDEILQKRNLIISGENNFHFSSRFYITNGGGNLKFIIDDEYICMVYFFFQILNL